MSWWSKAWAWLKANWKSVLIGVSTLGLGLLVGKALRKPQKVVNPELLGAAKKQREAQELEDKERLAAAKKRDERLAEVVATHDKKLQNLTVEQNEKVDELKDDPEKLNEYLLNVGKDIRS